MEGPLFEIDGERLKRFEQVMDKLRAMPMPKINLTYKATAGTHDPVSNVIMLAPTPESHSGVVHLVRGKTRATQMIGDKLGIKFIPLEMCDRDMRARIDAAMADKRAELKKRMSK